jgi:hypothetical protein
MRKLLLSILLMFFSTVLFAQPSFLRGHRLHIGSVNSSGKVVWDEGSDSDVLIKIDGSLITIYSATRQDLHCTERIGSGEDQTKWKAVDQDGVICYIYIGYSEAADSTYLMVEYSNVWYCIYTYKEE